MEISNTPIDLCPAGRVSPLAKSSEVTSVKRNIGVPPWLEIFLKKANGSINGLSSLSPSIGAFELLLVIARRSV